MSKIKTNIKSVTIDFWDTIFVYPDIKDVLTRRVAFFYSIFSKYDKNISKEKTFDLVVSIYSFFEKIWNEEFRTPIAREMILYTIEEAGLQNRVTEEDIVSLTKFNEEFIRRNEEILLIENADKVIKQLYNKGYDLIIISDTGFEPGTELRKILLEHDLLKYFTYTIFSDEAGFSKPDKQAFQLALDKSKKSITFANMLHIGDREEKDIIGANSVGMQSILFAGTRDDDFEKSTADYKVKSWMEILEIFEDK